MTMTNATTHWQIVMSMSTTTTVLENLVGSQLSDEKLKGEFSGA